MADPAPVVARSLIVGEELPTIGDSVDRTLLVARRPYDLEAHASRIRSSGDDHATYLALVDLFIASPPEGSALRERMLREARGRLSSEQVRFFKGVVKTELGATEPVPDAAGSVLWTGTVEGRDLLGGSATPVAAGASVREPRVASPTPVASGPRAGGRRLVLVGAALVVIVIVVAAVVVVVGLSGGRGNDSESTAHTSPSRRATTGATRATTGVPSSAPTTVAPSTSAPPTLPEPEPEPEPTPIKSGPAPDDATAARRLDDVTARDLAAVEALEGTWVPQIASITTDPALSGRAENERTAWSEYRVLAERFPDALLLRSDAYPSLIPGYRVVVIPLGAESPAEALRWCSDNGLGRRYCYAQLLARGPVDGPAAAYLPG